MRDRAYIRKMRKKHILRKKRINQMHHADMGWYKFDGMYSKGKIHCSCYMCAFRKYNKNEKTESDMRRIEKMNQREHDYFEGELIA